MLSANRPGSVPPLGKQTGAQRARHPSGDSGTLPLAGPLPKGQSPPTAGLLAECSAGSPRSGGAWGVLGGHHLPESSEGNTRPGCYILRARWVQFTDTSFGKAISSFFIIYYYFFFLCFQKAAAPTGLRLLGQSTLVALPFFTCQPSRKYCTGSLGRVCGTVSKACCPVGINSLMVKSRLTL